MLLLSIYNDQRQREVDVNYYFGSLNEDQYVGNFFCGRDWFEEKSDQMVLE